MSKQAKRKRELPKPSFFDSPPHSPPTSAAGRKEPPDQKRLYFNSREPKDPEIMEFKELWADPEILFDRDGLIDGFIQALQMEELVPSQVESYTVAQIKEIQNIISNLASQAVITPIELVRRIAQLTASVSKDVSKAVNDLANQFAKIANGETLELNNTRLRF
jgi:hypothetical protein